MSALPTPGQMIAETDAKLREAYRALGDAADWLRSDWQPGTTMTGEQAELTARMRKAIAAAKAAINEGRP